MPRYFLHIRDGDQLIEDPDGSDLPNLDSARLEAVASARQILSARVLSGDVIDGQRIEIVDDSGALRATILMRDVLKLK